MQDHDIIHDNTHDINMNIKGYLLWYHMPMISWFYVYDISLAVTYDIIDLWYHTQYHMQNHIWYHRIKTMISSMISVTYDIIPNIICKIIYDIMESKLRYHTSEFMISVTYDTSIIGYLFWIPNRSAHVQWNTRQLETFRLNSEM
jgi:hypothetical protein